jgi:DNA-binding NarL/FixJ family response regulator
MTPERARTRCVLTIVSSARPMRSSQAGTAPTPTLVSRRLPVLWSSLAPSRQRVLGGLGEAWLCLSITRTPDISPRTAAKHLKRIYRQLNVTSQAAAVYDRSTNWPTGRNGSR